MAFLASTVMRVMNETSGSFVDTVVPYNFISESHADISAEFSYGLISEAANVMDVIAGSEDLLAEAAITGNPNFMVIQESVLATIKEGIIKYWNKLVEFVKGLITKLKGTLERVRKKTTAWVKTMEPLIKAGAAKSGASTVTHEMFDYDVDYIINGMSANLETMMSDWAQDTGVRLKAVETAEAKAESDANKAGRSNVSIQSRASSPSDAAEQYNKSKASITKDVNDIGDNKDDTKAQIELWSEETTRLTRDFEDWNEQFPDKIAKLFGVSGGATSMDELWADVKRNARGGDDKKTSQYVADNYTTYLDAVRGAEKTIESLTKKYQAHYTELHKYGEKIKALNKKNAIGSKDAKQASNKLLATANENLRKQYEVILKKTQAYETAMNSARNINVGLVEEMAGAYMGALTKLANAKKGKKNDEED